VRWRKNDWFPKPLRVELAPNSGSNCSFKALLTPRCRVLLDKITWFEASQEILRISRNPTVHYRTHKRPLPVPKLGQPNPVRIPTSHLLEIHPNIIHPSTPGSPQWSLSLRFPPPRPYTPPSPHPYALHAQPISFFSILSPAQYWVRSTKS